MLLPARRKRRIRRRDVLRLERRRLHKVCHEIAEGLRLQNLCVCFGPRRYFFHGSDGRHRRDKRRGNVRRNRLTRRLDRFVIGHQRLAFRQQTFIDGLRLR